MVTEKRDLTSGLSVWLGNRKHSKLSVGSVLSKNRSDIIVVGTGISGALVADALLNAGFSVLAVDRRKIMSGSTSASTALLEFEIDNPLIHLEKKIGKTMAARAWWRSAQSVQALSDRISDLGIECDFFPRSTLYLPGDLLGVRDLKHETIARQKLGLRSSFVDRTELEKLNGIQAAGAILSKGNGELDPVRLVHGLWKNFIKNGGHVVENVEVTEVDQSRSFVRLKTSDGQTITSRYAVFCTGYEVLKCARPRNYKIISTWVLGTRRQPANLWRGKSLIWEAADPYLYLRTTPDGRILAGGEDEPFSNAELRDRMLSKKIAAIAKKAKKIWPGANFEAEYAWTGSFGESPTGLPAIGPIKGLSRCYAVLGFGGNGISYSMLAAQLVSRHIQGIDDPDAGLFAL